MKQEKAKHAVAQDDFQHNFQHHLICLPLDLGCASEWEDNEVKVSAVKKNSQQPVMYDAVL